MKAHRSNLLSFRFPVLALVVAILVYSCVGPLFGADAPLMQSKEYQDTKSGLRIEYVGEIEECVGAGICIRLPLGEGTVHVFVDTRPSVLLPGTYGGRYYFAESTAAPALANRVLCEQVVLNGYPFSKDYWIAYGGAGTWDTVVNCYAEWHGLFYVISLHHTFVEGIPSTNVHPSSAAADDQLVSEALARMLDGTNQAISIFNAMLATVEVGE